MIVHDIIYVHVGAMNYPVGFVIMGVCVEKRPRVSRFTRSFRFVTSWSFLSSSKLGSHKARQYSQSGRHRQLQGQVALEARRTVLIPRPRGLRHLCRRGGDCCRGGLNGGRVSIRS